MVKEEAGEKKKRRHKNKREVKKKRMKKGKLLVAIRLGETRVNISNTKVKA